MLRPKVPSAPGDFTGGRLVRRFKHCWQSTRWSCKRHQRSIIYFIRKEIERNCFLRQQVICYAWLHLEISWEKHQNEINVNSLGFMIFTFPIGCGGTEEGRFHAPKMIRLSAFWTERSLVVKNFLLTISTTLIMRSLKKVNTLCSNNKLYNSLLIWE